jgi:hypothetical protein
MKCEDGGEFPKPTIDLRFEDGLMPFRAISFAVNDPNHTQAASLRLPDELLKPGIGLNGGQPVKVERGLDRELASRELLKGARLDAGPQKPKNLSRFNVFRVLFAL